MIENQLLIIMTVLKKKFLLKSLIRMIGLSLCLLPVTNMFSQELNATVKINANQIEGTYKQMFTTLESELTEFINNNKWSEAKFSNVEKIDCSFLFTIKSVTSQDSYAGELTVQARRPVYNSAYTTSTFNFRDTDITFSYQENEPIVYNQQTVESNLVAIVTYYIYMILGVDFDTFSPGGGTGYFRQAENIVNLCQGIGETGWRAFDNPRNRHGLVYSMLEESMRPYRELWYNYHRKGLDAMSQGAEKGKSVITECISNITTIHDVNSRSPLLTVFIDSKLDVRINVYSLSAASEKENIHKTLSNIYPSYTKRLDEIKKVQK